MAIKIFAYDCIVCNLDIVIILENFIATILYIYIQEMWTLHPETTCGFSVLWKCHVSYSGHKWREEFPRLQCKIFSSTCRNQRYGQKMMLEEKLSFRC